MQNGGLNKPVKLSENKPVCSLSTAGLPEGLNIGNCECVHVRACREMM